MKRTISLLLTLIMIFSAVPFVAFAADETCEHLVKEWNYYKYKGPGDGKVFDCTDKNYIVSRNGKCTLCGITVDEQLGTLPQHTPVPLERYDVDGNIIAENFKEPTCTENGYTKSRCEVCNTVITNVILADGHTYGEREVYIMCFPNATDTQGVYRRYCTKAGCDGYSEETITDHNHIIYDGVEASCFGPGKTDSKICLDCGTEAKSVEIEKLNHKDADGNGRCDYCFSNFLGENVFCSCICHSTNSFMQFLMPLIRIIWQILGMDNCHGDCNSSHY